MEKSKIEELHEINLPWLEYLQLSHLFQKQYGTNLSETPLTIFETLMKTDSLLKKGLISKLYKCLLNLHNRPAHAFQRAWEKDLQTKITDDMWAAARSTATFHSRTVNVQMAVYKIYYRWHLTPYRLHKIHPITSNLCWTGCGSCGTYIHCLWSCPRIQPFWDQVLRYISLITNIDIPKSPEILLLNIWRNNKPDHIMLDLIVLLLSAATSLITLHWKTTRVPSIRDWFIKLWDLFIQDKISVAILRADNLPTPPNLQER